MGYQERTPIWFTVLSIVMALAMTFLIMKAQQPTLDYWEHWGSRFGPTNFYGYSDIGNPIGYNYLRYGGMVDNSIVITVNVGYNSAPAYFKYTQGMNLSYSGFTLHNVRFDDITQRLYYDSVSYK